MRRRGKKKKNSGNLVQNSSTDCECCCIARRKLHHLSSSNPYFRNSNLCFNHCFFLMRNGRSADLTLWRDERFCCNVLKGRQTKLLVHHVLQTDFKAHNWPRLLHICYSDTGEFGRFQTAGESDLNQLPCQIYPKGQLDQTGPHY